MKRLKSLSRNALFAVAGAGVLVLLLLPVVAFAIDELRANGEVARNVSAAGVDLGGLGHDDALLALRDYESELATTPASFRIADSVFEILPREVGLDIDEESILETALEQRRQGGFLGRFGDWFGSFGDQIELAVPVTIDPDLFDDMLDGWEQEAINDPAFEGGLIISEGQVLPDYPRAGEGIDRKSAQVAALAAVQTLERRPTTLATRNLQPVVTQADIDNAVERATRIIDSPIVLQANDPEFEIEFTPDVLASSLVVEVRATEPPRVDLSFSLTPITRVLEPLRNTIEQPARDAEFVIDQEDNVTLRPSRRQTLLDIGMVVDRVFDVADRGGATGTFPFAEGVQAEFTTEMAEAMGEITRVSSFTTEHSCCEPRVTNIQTMAKAVDGAIVMPGEQFDLNGYVGKRTEEKGYVPAPQIFEGEIEDAVGGGVSQFATTIYNAMFFGCYQDITHKAHSFYFSRYPEGREATVSWGGPELIFQNDSDAILIIKTAFTSQSITVKMFGNKGGRDCTAGLGDRYRYVDQAVEYEEDASLPPGTEAEKSAGSRGWTIDIFRFMVYPDGSDETQAWSHTYLPRAKIIRAHPCDLDGAPSPCLIKIPNVVGEKAGKATSTLETWTFEVSKKTVDVDDEALDGEVISQSPAAGLPHARGAKVTIEVAKFVDDGGGNGGDIYGDFGLQ